MSTNRTISRFTAAAVFGFSLLKPVAAFGPEAITITPTTFDFGWAPDNAKIVADFIIKNTGSESIPITSVQPTCGCTASQFTPGALGTNDEKKVQLTFNTRGYAGSGFSKAAKVRTDNSNVEYTVYLTGFVVDAAAKVFPDEGGVASFSPETKEKSKTIKIQNKSDKDVTLEIVQAPASWATAKLAAMSVKAGASVPMEVTAEGPYDQSKETSITLSAKDGTAVSRLTVAIRTGVAPAPMHSAPPPPVATPAAPKKK